MLPRKPFPVTYVWEEAPNVLREYGVLLTGAKLGLDGPDGDAVGGGIARGLVLAGCRNLVLSVLPAEEAAAQKFAEQTVAGLDDCAVQVFVKDLRNEKGVHDLAFLAGPHLANSARIALVHNAGITYTQHSEDATWSDYETIFGVNFAAPFFLTQKLLSAMADRPGSVSVKMSSVHAAHSKVGNLFYGASKAAMEQMTRSLALEYAGLVRFLAIRLGWHITAEHRALAQAAGESIDVEAAGRAKMAIQRLPTPTDAANAVVKAIAFGGAQTGNIEDCTGGEALALPGERYFTDDCIKSGQGAQYMQPES